MEVEFMVVCDYAVVTPDQKLTMVGTFDRIFAADMPARVPALGVAARLRDANPQNAQSHMEFEFRIKAPDGTNIAAVGRTIHAEQIAPQDGGIVLPLGFMFINITFPKYGAYQVELWVDKQRLCAQPIWLSRPPVPGTLPFATAPSGVLRAATPAGPQAMRIVLPATTGKPQ